MKPRPRRRRGRPSPSDGRLTARHTGRNNTPCTSNQRFAAQANSTAVLGPPSPLRTHGVIAAPACRPRSTRRFYRSSAGRADRHRFQLRHTSYRRYRRPAHLLPALDHRRRDENDPGAMTGVVFFNWLSFSVGAYALITASGRLTKSGASMLLIAGVAAGRGRPVDRAGLWCRTSSSGRSDRGVALRRVAGRRGRRRSRAPGRGRYLSARC